MIKRILLKSLENHLKSKEITLITGARQVGKTTLMQELLAGLKKVGSKCLFLNLDYEADAQYFTSQNTLIQKIELEIGKEKGYVFIDEIQRKENAGLFLKGIYDLGLPYKFIVSGSGSLELKEKIHESLAGRKRIFELSPITFEEFVNYKTGYKYENKLADFLAFEKTKTKDLLFEYLGFGGYPRVVTENTMAEKIRIIDEIYSSYVERDIVYLLRTDRPESFNKLIKLMASQIGSLVNYSSLSSVAGISSITLKKYLWYAEKTFILNTVTPFFRNIQKEISKSPIVYFNDLGLRNYMIGSFGQMNDQKQSGFVFQNFIYNLLKQKIAFSGASLHFWRTISKAEVDFIIRKGDQLIPIEVKLSSPKLPNIQRSMHSFIEKYEPEEALIINLDYKNELKRGKTTVKFIPFYELLSLEL